MNDLNVKSFNAFSHVWVVGASTGIGAALAKALDKDAQALYLSARNESALNKISKGLTSPNHTLPIDITDTKATEQTITSLKQALNEKPLSMVVLNAGTCEYMDSDNLDLALLDRVMQTNFFSIVNLIQQCIPLLKEAAAAGVHKPKLVIMCSSVTYQALPRAHAYGASKVALRYFAECLKIDLQQSGIDVRLISPGFVKTSLTDKNDFPMPFLINSEQAAEKIVKGLKGRAFDINFPKPFIYLIKTLAWLPTSVRFKVLKSLSRAS